jgi:hypothetical protein
VEGVWGNWEVPPAAPGAAKAQVTDCYKERHVSKSPVGRRGAAGQAEGGK